MQFTLSAPALGNNTSVFADALTVRTKVFVHEQNIPLENEVDALDGTTWHLVAYDHDARPVGTLRIVPFPHLHEADVEGPDSHPEGNYVKLGRLATVKELRGRGVGRLLVEGALRECRALVGKEWDGRVLVHAQVSAKEAWRRMGFVEDAGMGGWVEEEIEHVGMWRSV